MRPAPTHPPTLFSHAQAHMRKPSRLSSEALIDFHLQSNNGAIRSRSACDNIYLGKIDLGDMCISLNLADREHTRRPKFADVSHLPRHETYQVDEEQFNYLCRPFS
jgi:hypothetical protein